MVPAIRLRRFKRYRLAITILFFAVLWAVAANWHWPYVISGPGSAEPVHPRVQTGKTLDEKGAFLFTTVATYAKPDTFSLVYGWLHPRMDIKTLEEATGGTVNYEAYRNLSTWQREKSEADAILAVYNAIGRNVQVEQTGVIVYFFLESSKAREHGLQEGDIITAVDGKPVRTGEELIAILNEKKPGDMAKLSGTRGGKPFEAEVPLIRMDNGRTGIGFSPQPVYRVTPHDPIKMNFNDTGGPSAGLMIALELVAQLTGEDLTRGYRIAGTGTIAADGTVGQIGGIRYKLMAADRERADYFLVPYVKQAGLGNWKEAEEVVRELNLSPELVPVTSLQQAMEFLRGLPPKES